MSVSLDTLHQRLIRELWEGSYPLIETTDSAGDTTSVIISRTAYSSASANAYDGLWIYGPGVGTAPKIARVTRGGFNTTTGDFTVSPAMGEAIGDTASAYFLRGLHIDEIDEAINNVLKNLYLPRYGVLSLVSDPNMDDSGTDGYTAITSASLSKVATATSVFTGTQSLQVAANTNDGVRTEALLNQAVGALSAYESGQYYISIIARTVAGTSGWDVVFYDVTNASAIRTVEFPFATGGQWREVRFDETAPAGCEAVELRVIAQGSTHSIYIDSISLLHSDTLHYKLPNQVTDASYVEGLFQLPQGDTTGADDIYVPFSTDFSQLAFEPLRDLKAVQKSRITVPPPTGNPYWIKYRGTGSTLSQNDGDTGTTEADEELVVQGALSELAGRLKSRFPFGSAGYVKYDRIEQQAHMNYRRILDELGMLRPKPEFRRQHRVRA